MSEGSRRSGRATKGQHSKASSSPAPNLQKPAKTTKTKGKKKQEVEAEDNEDEDGAIRCICGNDDPEDRRAFIGCEACLVWQHNVCMGEPEEEEDVPDHYFCEECRPEEHRETLAALAKGEAIWEVRSKKWQAWKKMSASRRKSKGKGAEDTRPPWLKNDVKDENEEEVNGGSAEPEEETGTKRKRESVKPEPAEAAPSIEETAAPAARPDKRRKSSQAPSKVALDPDTAVVDIDKLPNDRKKAAQGLSKVILEDLQDRVKSAGYTLPSNHTPKSLADRYASLIEYALYMNHNSNAKDPAYGAQFRTLWQNLKRNKVLIERLLEDSVSPDELAVMESEAMASEDQQREFKRLREMNDRQTVVDQAEGPRYRSSHKGLEKIEDERMEDSGGNAQPVRERTSIAEEGAAGSPSAAGVDGGPVGSPTQAKHGSLGGGPDARRQSAAPGSDRRASSQFDMNNIWQKTNTGSAQSPTSATGPRPLQMPARRQSSVVQQQHADGAKDDPDVDRLLQEDDDMYEPQGYTSDETIVWHGRIVHSGEGEPLVNARFVAGRDMASTASWRDVLPAKLSVDGRLAVQKAEEYLCGLQWSQNSDVSVLSLAAVDNIAEFNRVFDYFLSRGRYAVINKDKPSMVKDLYIIPVEKGAQLPEHISMLEHNTLKTPVEERCMLATFVVARAPGAPQIDGGAQAAQQQAEQGGGGGMRSGSMNGGQQQQQHLPQHMRVGGPGPAGSPLNASAPTFSPAQSTNAQSPMTGCGAQQQQQPGGIPPSPYDQQAMASTYPQLQQQPHANPLIADILGPRQWDPTALQIVAAQPDMTEDKLRNLRQILEDDVVARTQIEALARRLFG